MHGANMKTAKVCLIYGTSCLDVSKAIFRFTVGLQNIFKKKYTLCKSIKVKAKITLEQSTKAQRGSRGKAVLFP